MCASVWNGYAFRKIKPGNYPGKLIKNNLVNFIFHCLLKVVFLKFIRKILSNYLSEE